MQSRTSWQDVALVAVLCGIIVLAGVFAPGVVTILSGVASTLIGAFFVNRSKTSDASKDDTPKATVLKLVTPKSEAEKGDPS